MSETPVRRGGRPPLPVDERRSVDVHLRLSPQEADTAYKLAQKHESTLNDVLRQALKILARRAQLL